MADWIRCKCGARYRVLPRNAGTTRACDECGRPMTFPELEDAVEMLEEVDADDHDEDADRLHELEDEDEGEDRVVSAQKRPKRTCYVCQEKAKGTLYTFIVGRYRWSHTRYGKR